MTKPVRFDPAAQEELDAAVAWYDAHGQASVDTQNRPLMDT